MRPDVDGDQTIGKVSHACHGGLVPEPAETGGLWEMHHYMLYLDSAGCFEAVAASWSLLPEKRIE
jgi:hypothetical protein